MEHRIPKIVCREVRKYGIVDFMGDFLWGIENIGTSLEKPCLTEHDSQGISVAFRRFFGFLPGWFL